MAGGEVTVVAGIGCRRGCQAAAIVAAVRAAEAEAGRTASLLAAPWFKHAEPSLQEAAVLLGLPLRLVPETAMQAVQDRCPTRSAITAASVGLASVAEAAALAASGGCLVLPRVVHGPATCALAAL